MSLGVIKIAAFFFRLGLWLVFEKLFPLTISGFGEISWWDDTLDGNRSHPWGIALFLQEKKATVNLRKHNSKLWKKCYMKCGVWNQLKIWSSHLLDNLSNCLMNLKNSGDSTGFEPMTSAMPVQCSNQLSYEVTQLRAGQFVGLMFSRERNVVWKKCYMKCGVWNQLKIWSSHLLDNLSNCLMNLKISGDSTGFEPMTPQRSWVRIPLSHLNFSGSWDNCLNCPASARIISSVDNSKL